MSDELMERSTQPLMKGIRVLVIALLSPHYAVHALWSLTVTPTYTVHLSTVQRQSLDIN